MTISTQLFSVDGEMVNLMCQLSWVMGPRYLVNYYSGYFCEGVFWVFCFAVFVFVFKMRLTFKSVDTE